MADQCDDIDHSCQLCHPPVIQLRVSFRVTDPEKLIAFARKQVGTCWGEDAIESLAEAVYEAVIGSNMNPDNRDLGIEQLVGSGPAYEQTDGITIEMPDEE